MESWFLSCSPLPKSCNSIYIALTLLEILLLLAGGMPLFDTLTLSFGTAGTGGFGIKNDSMAGYSPYLQNVVTVFMILFGVNFSFYFLLLLRKPKKAFRMEEVRCYLGIIAAAIVIITINIKDFILPSHRPSSRQPSRSVPSSPQPDTPLPISTHGLRCPRPSW